MIWTSFLGLQSLAETPTILLCYCLHAHTLNKIPPTKDELLIGHFWLQASTQKEQLMNICHETELLSSNKYCRTSSNGLAVAALCVLVTENVPVV